MNKAEELLKISRINYNKSEQKTNKALQEIYSRAEAAARQGYESISYNVEDSLIKYMIKKKLREEGFKVCDYSGDYGHAIIIDWGE